MCARSRDLHESGPEEMTARRRTRGLDTICEILIPFLLLYNLSRTLCACDRDSVTAADITIMVLGCASSFSLAQSFRGPRRPVNHLVVSGLNSEISSQISSFPLTPFFSLTYILQTFQNFIL